MTRRALSAILVASLLLAALPGSAAADAPDACALVGSIARPSNTWLYDTLPNSSDRDYFVFELTSARWVLIQLAKLPADYALSYYANCAYADRVSNRPGTQFEEIWMWLPARKHVFLVSPVGTAHSSSTYAIRFKVPPVSLSVLSYSSWADSQGMLHVAGELLNNTTARRKSMRVTAYLYNSANQQVASTWAWTLQDVAAARARAPFHLSRSKPAGYHHLRLVVASATTSTAPIGKLTATMQAPFSAAGQQHYVGEVHNANSFTANDVEVVVTLYDKWGKVWNAAAAATTPATIVTGGYAPVDVAFSNHATIVNRSAVRVQGIR